MQNPEKPTNDKDYVIECDLFHTLTKKAKRDDVDGIFCAIQAAMAYNCEYVDVGYLVGQIMPPGRTTTDAYCSNIGPEGLAFFHFLYDIKLKKAGCSDYHEYEFTRKHLPKTLVAYIKTSCDPGSEAFKTAYEKQVEKLKTVRRKILAENIYLSSEQIIMNS